MIKLFIYVEYFQAALYVFVFFRYIQNCNVEDTSTDRSIPIVKDTCFAGAVGATNGLDGSTNMMDKVNILAKQLFYLYLFKDYFAYHKSHLFSRRWIPESLGKSQIFRKNYSTSPIFLHPSFLPTPGFCTIFCAAEKARNMEIHGFQHVN